MNCWESLFVHTSQQHDILIEEQKVNDIRPINTMANATRRHPEYTTLTRGLGPVQFSSHMNTSNSEHTAVHHIQNNLNSLIILIDLSCIVYFTAGLHHKKFTYFNDYKCSHQDINMHTLQL